MRDNTVKYGSMRELFREKRDEFLDKCTSCGFCLNDCQPYKYLNMSISEADLFKHLRQFLEGDSFSQEVYDFAFSCSLCGCCEKVCPEEINFMFLMDITKAELVDRGYKSPPSCKLFLPNEKYNASRVFEALQMKPEERRWITGIPINPVPKKVVFFLSCFFHQTSQDAFTSLDILDQMGIDYVAIGGVDFCCGEMDLSVGNCDESDRLARNLVEAISAFQPETVIFLCGGCYYRFKIQLPMFMDLPFNIKPLSLFYLENISKVHFTRVLNETVTYHDPCGLGRRSGFFDVPRELIKKIPGVELVEMEQVKEKARCCGGMTMITYPPVAIIMGEELGKTVKATGTGKVITSCTGCHLTLKGIGQRMGFSTETYICLLGRAMGLDREDRLAQYLGLKTVDAIVEAAKENIEKGPFSEDEMRRALSLFIPAGTSK